MLSLLLLLSACSAAASTPLSDTTRLGAHNDTSTPFNFVSVPALTRQRYDGHDLRRTAVLQRTGAFTRYAVRYLGAGLEVTGIMDVPTAPGRHPVVVIAHGYVPPASYRTGDTLVHEQAYLARRGFVAFQIDYRNYGGSTRESAGFVAHPRGYPEDLINAVVALRKARLPFVDPDRVVYFGRSMGGGVVLDALVARPHLVDAAVLYSPVSARAADDFRRWVEPGTELRQRVVADYGTPVTRPRVWRQASSRAYLDRVAVPVLVNHGTADSTCPVRWSRATVAALRRDGKDARLLTYPGQQHRFGPRATALLMRRTVDFYRAHLDAPGQASTK